MSKKLNPSQLRAVEARGNTVVSAGAGSGKTTVLALRYLRLIREEAARVEEILTLTFTKKAAAEMYRRIYDLLGEYREEAPVREALENFQAAQISTLDSFSARIAKGDSARYGIPGDFRTDPRDTDDLIREEALEFLLFRRNRPAMERLLDDYGFDRTRQEIWEYLAKNCFSLVRPPDFSGLAENQLRIMKEELTGALEKIAGVVRAFEDLDPSAGVSIGKWQETFAALDGELSEWESGSSSAPGTTAWKTLAAIFGRHKGPKVPTGKKTELVRGRELAEEYRAARETVLGGCAVLAQGDHIRETAFLAAEFQERVIRRKRRTAVLSFQDVAELAVEILKTNPGLRRFYKDRFRYIMIDEFQDNNLLQKELLYLLAEKPGAEVPGIPGPENLDREKLYFVGDGKQSIYRFRGADVSVFMGLAEELAACGGESITLSTNYRSEPELIAFFNRLFPPIMEGNGENFEAVFEPLESRPVPSAGTGGPNEPAVRPLIRLYHGDDQTLSEDSLSRQESEAYTLASFIRDTVEKKSLMVSPDGAPRPAEYGDFALLLRSGGNQFCYERFFRNMGIPYTVEEPRSLFLEAPANDLAAFLNLLVYPADRVALASFLRSPFVNLSDDSLAALLLARRRPSGFAGAESGDGEEPDGDDAAGPAGENGPQTPEPEELFDDAGEGLMLREEDRRKYRRAAEMYRTFLALADRVPHRELVSRLWYDWGYSCFLLRQPAYHHYLEYFDFFFAMAGEADRRGLSLASFLDEVAPLLGSSEKLPDLKVMRRTGGGVRIMTIHSAKGLEFPVTILADCGNIGRRTGGGACCYSPETGISLRLEKTIREEDASPAAGKEKTANPVYDRIRQAEEAREIAELKRLLYVALTRAESHLILAGYHHKQNRNSLNTLLNLFLHSFGWRPSGGKKQPMTDPRDLPELAPYLFSIEPVPKESVEKSYRYRRGIAPEKALRAVSGKTHGGPPDSRRRTIEKREMGVSRYLEQYREGGGGIPSGPGELLPVLAADELIVRKGLEALFGTLCHFLLEEAVKGRPRELEKARLLAGLEDGEAEILLRDAGLLADRFFQSDLGQKLRARLSSGAGTAAGENVRSELGFLLKRETPEGPVFLRGQIDLVIRFSLEPSGGDRGSGRPGGSSGPGSSPQEELWVIDFKTDREKQPEAHRAQLEIYREAVVKMEEARSGEQKVRGGEQKAPGGPPEVRCFVCYLRDASVLEI